MTTYQILWICTLIFFISIHLTFCLFSTLLSSLFSWVYKSYKSKSWLISTINDINIFYFSKLRKNTFKLRYIPRVWKIFNKKLIISFISLVTFTLIWFWFLIRGRYEILLYKRRLNYRHMHHIWLIKYTRLSHWKNGLVDWEHTRVLWYNHRLTYILVILLDISIFFLFLVVLFFFYLFVLVIWLDGRI